MKPGEQTRFLLKLLPHARIYRQCLFDRDGDAESLIDRFIHSTHSALTELLDDTITVLQQGAGN